MEPMRNWASAALLTFATAGIVSAQPPTQVPPGQARPGQVQPGQVQPGQVQPGQVQPGQAQTGHGQPGQVQQPGISPTMSGSITQTPWFSNQDVRQRLNLSNDQFNRLNTNYQNAWTQYQKGVAGLGNLTPQERTQRMQDLQRQFYNSLSTTTNETLTDPQLRSRYNQLYYQYRGYGAFDDPTVQKDLGLTAEQQQKLAQYHQDWQNSMADLERTYATDPQGATRRFEEMRTRDQNQIQNVLTPQQRERWQQMTGEPYTFQPSIYFQRQNSQTPKK